MIHTQTAIGGACVAPHHLAAQAGRDILRDGGNAVEAMVAAAATIAVVYPHMNALGGDGFWLIQSPGQAPVAIDASGPSAQRATPDFYQGYDAIPSRGPLAALTVAGTLSGWQQALTSVPNPHRSLPVARLLEDAIHHARNGVPVTQSQSALTRSKFDQLAHQPGFADTYLMKGEVPAQGALLRQPDLARTLEHLSARGLDDFYRGELAAHLGQSLDALGSPLTTHDLNQYQAKSVTPLALRLTGATVYNLPPPTQGVASLMILGLYERYLERLGTVKPDSFEHLHGLVEATKQAFLVRDRLVTDPDSLPESPDQWLAADRLDSLADRIDANTALPWPHEAHPGDTVWMGAVDKDGCSVSFIQSVFWEFGSGVVVPETGMIWQNRGTSFSLQPDHLNALQPGRQPFHTLNPALAKFDDGRVMPYGTMGGEGQPQTQAALFSRYVWHSQGLQEAITAPRWLLGRTWGDQSTTLKLESRFGNQLADQLRSAGHDVEHLNDAFSDTMGHAGALVRHPDGVIEGACDPRSDGAVAAF